MRTRCCPLGGLVDAGALVRRNRSGPSICRARSHRPLATAPASLLLLLLLLRLLPAQLKLCSGALLGKELARRLLRWARV